MSVLQSKVLRCYETQTSLFSLQKLGSSRFCNQLVTSLLFHICRSHHCSADHIIGLQVTSLLLHICLFLPLLSASSCCILVFHCAASHNQDLKQYRCYGCAEERKGGRKHDIQYQPQRLKMEKRAYKGKQDTKAAPAEKLCMVKVSLKRLHSVALAATGLALALFSPTGQMSFLQRDRCHFSCLKDRSRSLSGTGHAHTNS